MTVRPTPTPTPTPPDRPASATGLGIAAVVGPITGFSLMNVIVKIADAPALTFALYRLALGAGIMLVVLEATGRRLTWAVLRRALPGGVLFGLNIALFFSALKLTSVADVLIVGALQPALTLTVAGPLFGERVRAHQILWTMVSLGGVALVIVGTSGTPVWSLRGDLLAGGSLLAWTVYWLLTKRVRREVRALEYMTGVTVAAALVIVPVALVSGQSLRLRWQDWPWLALFVLGAQGGHVLLAWSHAQVDVSVSSLLFLVEPVVAPVAALVVLGEPLPAISIAGGLLTVAAVGFVVQRATRGAKVDVAPEPAPA